MVEIRNHGLDLPCTPPMKPLRALHCAFVECRLQELEKDTAALVKIHKAPCLDIAIGKNTEALIDGWFHPHETSVLQDLDSCRTSDTVVGDGHSNDRHGPLVP